MNSPKRQRLTKLRLGLVCAYLISWAATAWVGGPKLEKRAIEIMIQEELDFRDQAIADFLQNRPDSPRLAEYLADRNGPGCTGSESQSPTLSTSSTCCFPFHVYITAESHGGARNGGGSTIPFLWFFGMTYEFEFSSQWILA